MAHLKRSARLAALIGALAVLCALFAAGVAETALPGGEAMLSIDFTVQPSEMVAPGEITMTFVIHNRGSRAVQNIYLTSEDGLLSEPLGQLKAGESQTLVRPHTVTQEELDAGAVYYTISHDPENPGGEKVVYNLSAAIVKGEQQPSVSFTRQLSSDHVVRGGQVTITYKLANTGNVPLNSLRIRDTLGDFTGRLERLGVGETKTFISRVTLNTAAQSLPELQYAIPSGKEYVLTLQAAPISLANSALNISFSVGQAVFNRDTADAILILTNEGNVGYTGITVVDDVYGGVIADAISLPVGGKSVEISHTYPLRGEGEYRWRITGMNGAGEKLDMRTNTLTVADTSVGAASEILLEAGTNTPKINRAGRVTFDFTITNTGGAMARDALLYELERGEIRRLAVLPPGAPTRCSVSYEVSADADFIFCLAYADAQGHQRVDSYTPIRVEIAPDGVDPEREEETGPGLRGESIKPGNSSATFIVLLIIAGAALTVMFTILAVTSIRARRDRFRRVAAEKQRIKAELEKTGSIPVVRPAGKKKKK